MQDKAIWKAQPGRNAPSLPPVEGAFEYRYLTNELKELKNPVGENINGGVLTQSELGNGSLVPFFCKEYEKRTNNRVTAIHIAKGGSSIESWLPETERFKIATTKVLNGIKKVQESFVVEKIYFIWLQGESDAEKSRIVIHVFTKTVRQSSLTVYPFTADYSYIYEGTIYSAKQLEESGSAVGIISILRRKSCWRKEL